MASLGALLGTAIGGIGGFFLGGPPGAIAGAGIGAQIGGADDANNANIGLSRDQMDWQAQMSNTAHQREVADLKASGLNPVLSANAGASTPPGSLAQVKNVGEGLASNAQQLLQLQMQSNKLDSDIEVNDSNVSLNKALENKAKVDAKVNTFGIPEADLKNKAYNWILQQFNQRNKSGAQPKSKETDTNIDALRNTGLPKQFLKKP